MAQIHVIGRITADLDLKYGQSGNPYVRFSLAENLGSKEHARVQYYQVWAWNEDAVRLNDSKVRKGSLVRISGTLELEVYPPVMNSSLHIRCKLVLQYFTVLKAAISLVHKHLRISFCFRNKTISEVICTVDIQCHQKNGRQIHRTNLQHICPSALSYNLFTQLLGASHLRILYSITI